MRRFLVAAVALIAVVGCTSDSSLPNPTGKGTVRALNAIEGSPDIAFLVEERFQERLGYKAASGGRRWDDFEYRFNFEVSFLGEVNDTRVGSILQKIDADRDHTFVLTGQFDAPTILVWETDERSFDGTGTVFEARFAHAAPSLGDIDVYFAADGIAPMMGEERGTLSFGDLLDPIDVEAGDYVLTLTTAGDPSDIVYQSSAVAYAAGAALFLPVFDGDALDTAPYSVRTINALGGASSLPDARVPPTIRFFQAAIDLPPSDVYDDEMLMNQVLSDHQFGDITGDIDIAVGTTEYTYTAVGNTGAIQFESGINVVEGTHNNFIVIGEQGSRVATTFVPDRRVNAAIARLRIYHAALNHTTLDLYIVDPGTSIDDVGRNTQLTYSLLSTFTLDDGDFDVYLTVADEKTIVVGPVPLSVQFGDNVETIVLDTVDPATAEFRFVPAP